MKYRVKDGVERVAGLKVPPDRVVELTPEQARYELDQGKIALASPEPELGPKKTLSASGALAKKE